MNKLNSAQEMTDQEKRLREALEEAIECVGEFVDVHGNEWKDGTPLKERYAAWKAALAEPAPPSGTEAHDAGKWDAFEGELQDVLLRYRKGEIIGASSDSSTQCIINFVRARAEQPHDLITLQAHAEKIICMYLEGTLPDGDVKCMLDRLKAEQPQVEALQRIIHQQNEERLKIIAENKHNYDKLLERLAEQPQVTAMKRLSHDFVEEFCGGSETIEEILCAKLASLPAPQVTGRMLKFVLGKGTPDWVSEWYEEKADELNRLLRSSSEGGKREK